MMETTGIYRIGALGRSQAAKRRDGQWFVRDWLRSPWGLKWSRWQRVANRPAHAWYDPAAGEARLPSPGSEDDA